MARRRKGSAGWTTKRYKSPLWKYVHPVKYLRSEYRKAKRAMHPVKVIGRVTSLDQVARLGRTTTTRVNAGTRQADVRRAAKKTAAAQKKTAAKRADPYQVAAGIPARNRKAAASMAKATQPGKTVAVRKKNGQFNGRAVMDPRERALFEQAEQRAVDPVLLPRTPRRRS